jgi:hypothetical protein
MPGGGQSPAAHKIRNEPKACLPKVCSGSGKACVKSRRYSALCKSFFTRRAAVWHQRASHLRADVVGNPVTGPAMRVETEAAVSAKTARADLPSRSALGCLIFVPAGGEEFTLAGRHVANVWRRSFPTVNYHFGGYSRTSSVGPFHRTDIVPTTSEKSGKWPSDRYSSQYETETSKACGLSKKPRGGSEAHRHDPCQPKIRIQRKGLKGLVSLHARPLSALRLMPVSDVLQIRRIE